MNREILFRGKTESGNIWVYGSLLSVFGEEDAAIFIPTDSDEYNGFMTELVIPSTVGQFTGLLDKNGKRIFEGDIDQNNDVVMWCKNRNGWAMKIYDFPTKEVISCPCYQCDGYFEISDIDSDIEVIGNIHDNTEQP